MLGIFAMTSQGQSGSTLYMFNHGLSTAALFLVAGFLISPARLAADRRTSAGCEKVAPVLAGTFLVAGLSTLSLPGLAPFVSEFLVLVGTFTRYPVVGVIAVLGIVLAALYILLMYQRTMTGPVARRGRGMRTCACARSRRRAADVLICARVLPEAGARHHQPGGRRTRMQQVGVKRPASPRSPRATSRK